MFTHEHVGTCAGENFIFDVSTFQRDIVEPTIEALGEDWAEVMDIHYQDEVGNPEYQEIAESRFEDILEALAENRKTVLLPYTRTGEYRDPHLNYCYGMFRFVWRGKQPTRDEINDMRQQMRRGYKYCSIFGLDGIVFMRDIAA